MEIDDAYLGGERSGGKRGRGSQNKVPCIAAVQTTPEGKPVLACFSQQPFTSEEVRSSLPSRFRPRPASSPTGCGAFGASELIGAEHQAIVTGGGKARVELPEFKAVNTVLSNLKTALSGTYHAVKFAEYAHRYLAEVQYRFNRRFDLATIFSRLLRAAALTLPQPGRLLLAAEVRR